jgi:integrase
VNGPPKYARTSGQTAQLSLGAAGYLQWHGPTHLSSLPATLRGSPARSKAARRDPLPANTDKQRRETVVPICAVVRTALDRILAERPGLGAAYLFPSAESPDRPITKDRAKVWLRKAEKLAKLEHVEWSGFHVFRRKWATERKHLSAVDVATAGGWAGTETLQRCYQQADEATMLAVVLSGGELRERQA